MIKYDIVLTTTHSIFLNKVSIDNTSVVFKFQLHSKCIFEFACCFLATTIKIINHFSKLLSSWFTFSWRFVSTQWTVISSIMYVSSCIPRVTPGHIIPTHTHTLTRHVQPIKNPNITILCKQHQRMEYLDLHCGQ